MNEGNKRIAPVEGEVNRHFLIDKEKVERYNYALEEGIKITDIPQLYFKNKFGFRKDNLLYKYSEDEVEEFKRCKDDLVYFCEKYCFTMTDDGIRNVSLFDHQKRILQEIDQHDRVIWLSPRQSQKTSSIAFYIAHYLCFNLERNVLVVANKGETAIEIIDKVAIVYQNLPFFLKPGIVELNKKRLSFDNRCRVLGMATSDNPGLGYNVHFLYIDEFAHIPEHRVETLYKSVLPTLSASNIAKAVITSTPNGRNLFYTLWMNAMAGVGTFWPIRVDWWEIPGRDENWKQLQIADLGSEAAFNQEFGNDFLNTSNMLISDKIAELFKEEEKEYKWLEFEVLNSLGIEYSKLTWDPDFDFDNIKNDYFVFSLDPAEGVGKDYTVLNIFKVEMMTDKEIDEKKSFKDEYSFIKLRQVAIYRDNGTSITNMSFLLEKILTGIFNPLKALIILEVNFRCDIIVDKILDNPELDEFIFLHTEHNANSRIRSIGVKLNKTNKGQYIQQFIESLENRLLSVNEKNTLEEIQAFGIDNKNRYTSQTGNDDIVMSCTNASTVFGTIDWLYFIEEFFETIPLEKKKTLQKKIERDYNSSGNKNVSFMDAYEMIQKALT